MPGEGLGLDATGILDRSTALPFAMNPVRRIQRHNQGREPERLALKYRAMRASPFAFLRGTAHLFMDRMGSLDLPRSAPLAWACGDLHLQNFGSYKGDNRLVYFDLNDFDEAALAPATWDLLRLLASLRVASSDMGLRAAATEPLCLALLDSYTAALQQGKAYWLERETAQGLVHQLLDGLRTRSRKNLLDSRTVRKGRQRRLKLDGQHLLPASSAQQHDVTTLLQQLAPAHPVPGFFEVLDVARRVAGTGSLGLERFAILVQGKGAPDDHYLLDLKQVGPSCLLPHLQAQPQPAWPSEAHRVVAVQRRCQAVAMAFLHPLQWQGRDFLLRALQPSEDRISLAQAAQDLDALRALARHLGALLAWAQLRSAGRQGSATADALIAFAQRPKWPARLLAASRDSARQVRADAKLFNAAYDDGALAR